ncbi:Hypothetical protein NTJ_06443 [Nesidiocoris tenuis]|uniref:Uncharacterized protein n=1 Tax=Nesidiocoris tenuis TaxID=355587 RepID=A0ABN7AQB6_9HEMI|nr:Hypothetical protein NTJ_06443 [Nesidiocoris tenuis]
MAFVRNSTLHKGGGRVELLRPPPTPFRPQDGDGVGPGISLTPNVPQINNLSGAGFSLLGPFIFGGNPLEIPPLNLQRLSD